MMLNTSSASLLEWNVKSQRAAQWRASQGPSWFCHLTNAVDLQAPLLAEHILHVLLLALSAAMFFMLSKLCSCLY